MAEKTVLLTQQLLKPIKILKWKVSEGNSMSIGRVILLYDFDGVSKPEQRKLKSQQAGTVHKIIQPEGAIVKPGDGLLELRECIHPTVMKDMCAECGADLRKHDATRTASVPMVHAIPDLKVSEEVAQKLGRADGERLLRDRKLVLLVDLDQTLIHTTNDNIPPNIKDVYHFQLYGANSPWYHTRLRPGTHKFLGNVSPLFELHICTFGARNYAHTITTFLDNDQTYFSNRILSRDECFDPTSKKANLKALFPCGDNMVCIIDDREDVWNHALNLIHVKPYHFFQHTGDINAPPGLDKQENDDKEGVDLSILKSKLNGKNLKEHDKKNGVEKEKVNGMQRADDVNNVEGIESNESVNNEKTNGKDVDSKVTNIISTKEETIKKEDVEIDVQMENTVQNKNNGNEESTKIEDVDKIESDCKVQNNSDVDNINSEENSGCKDNVNSEDNGNELKNKEEELNDKKVENKEEELNDKKVENKDEDLIEIEDPDDYLLHLEDILRRIHIKFYEEYDKMESGDVPDLKQVIPNVRSEILKGTKLAFSGLVPTHIKLEQSKAYQVARSLGALVTQDLNDDSTHLVAVRRGTAKVIAGRRKKNLKIVTPDWLWSCAERWEHVEEAIYPLNSKGSKNRHPPPHCSSPEHVPNYPTHDTPAIRKRTPSGRFMDTINPLMSFSRDDIADMDKEVEDILDDESDESEVEEESSSRMDEANTKKEDETSSSSSSSDESQKIKSHKRTYDDALTQEDNLDTDCPSTKLRKEQLESDLDIDDSNSEASVDAPDGKDNDELDIMGAALEREFLSNSE
ncbi:PREDICTED: RNA polymerase II subunit A C-terminal domain phosphatase [Nicrophorus vespilloides]|uniref:RNA polymerase II subunit A C-terminal domain phosphatase n=1 Tax=Nicrophorus vespilloides TaxID=110193 RepID=A0ABM1NB29_NICVS|nr:PREDICTED: RNA polymerase II subunit A C-terminal domain phosphatase [Nicrophorus vespilloides]